MTWFVWGTSDDMVCVTDNEAMVCVADSDNIGLCG